MGRYVFAIVALILVGGFAAAVYFVQSPRGSSVKREHPWVSYLLVWPLILDADSNKRAGRFFTRREWLGWLVVVALVAFGVVVAR